MEEFRHIILSWGEEGCIVLIMLTVAVFIPRIAKLFNIAAEAAQVIILAICIATVVIGIDFAHHYFDFYLSTRAACFIVLYMWCALGMLFFTARSTSGVKLSLALLSQAGILYALYGLV